MIEKKTEEMCMNVAPAYIAVCVPRGADGMLRTPWCHRPIGHPMPHVCGEFKWGDGDYSSSTGNQ